MTGLAVGIASGGLVIEGEATAGGICSSYYRPADSVHRLGVATEDGAAYRFEIGGGHWIFGGDPVLSRFIQSLTPVKSYFRRSAVFVPELNLYVPYPLQNHLRYLPQHLRVKALTEMLTT